MLVANHDALAIDDDVERRLLRRELDLLLIARFGIDDLRAGAGELVEHRGERVESAPPAIDGQLAPACRELARACGVAAQARGVRGEVIVLHALGDAGAVDASERR